MKATGCPYIASCIRPSSCRSGIRIVWIGIVWIGIHRTSHLTLTAVVPPAIRAVVPAARALFMGMFATHSLFSFLTVINIP